MDENLRNIINRYFEGTASIDEEKTIKKWLESSSENMCAFLKERKLYDVTLLSGSSIENTHKIVRQKVWVKNLLKIAAVFAVIFSLGLLYMMYKSEKEESLFQTLYVPVGQRINLLLPDGTDVWLNAGTTLRYPISFSKKKRTVELDGEAYFNVAKKEDIPFVVKTSGYNIEVLGTEFNVDAYSNRQNFEAMLVRGKVKISSVQNSNDNVVLLPKYKACICNGALIMTPVDDYSSYRWKEGLICFNNESFSEIMHDFEKYYGLKIRIENEKVKNQYYSGKFRQTDGVDYALRVLQKDISFVYDRDDEREEIVIK